MWNNFLRFAFVSFLRSLLLVLRNIVFFLVATIYTLQLVSSFVSSLCFDKTILLTEGLLLSSTILLVSFVESFVCYYVDTETYYVLAVLSCRCVCSFLKWKTKLVRQIRKVYIFVWNVKIDTKKGNFFWTIYNVG